MAQGKQSVKVLENCRVSSPPGFIPPTPPPLKFFDFLWVLLPPVERLFFYPYHHTNSHFINTTLPNIKQSLSHALQHFYPFLGTLSWPPQSTKPQFNFKENSGVILTIAESDQDFSSLASHNPRDVNEFLPLVPQLPLSNVDVGTNEEVPLMAIQVTLFPNTGICIGISTLHVIGDGKTTSHFMKSWASICKSGDPSCLQPESLPSYDRSLIPSQLETTWLEDLSKLNVSQKCFYALKTRKVELDKVRATFVLCRSDLQRLKKWVTNRLNVTNQAPLHLSTFVLTLAYVWVCLIKVLPSDEHVDELLVFVVDCRERLNPPLPATYFGNCLMGCFADVKKNDLLGENGIAVAAEAIGYSLRRMLSEGVLIGGENMITKLMRLLSRNRFLSIAGSPKLGVYDTDFGWGKPKKVEVISVDSTAGAISLSERQDGEGGLEIGLVLNKLQMDAFASVFTNTLNLIS